MSIETMAFVEPPRCLGIDIQKITDTIREVFHTHSQIINVFRDVFKIPNMQKHLRNAVIAILLSTSPGANAVDNYADGFTTKGGTHIPTPQEKKAEEDWLKKLAEEAIKQIDQSN